MTGCLQTSFIHLNDFHPGVILHFPITRNGFEVDSDQLKIQSSN